MGAAVCYVFMHENYIDYQLTFLIMIIGYGNIHATGNSIWIDPLTLQSRNKLNLDLISNI